LKVMEQYFDVEMDGLRAASTTDLTRQELRGAVNTADVEDARKVEQVVTVAQGSRVLKARWEHDSDRRRHAFVVDSVVRGEEESSVSVTWNGKPIAVDKEGDQTITVPALGAFNVSSIRVIQGREEYVEVLFTDPLKSKQDLRGLIRVSGRSGLRFTVDGSQVKVYSGEPWTGTVEVTVGKGVQNVMGRKLAKEASERVTFEELKPQVRFAGKGVIVPTTQGLTVPIEAVNLRAIRVEALQVYEDNMSQFFQVNDYEGTSELRRVGRVVWSSRVPLELPPNRNNTWVRLGLDLSPLVQKHPNGMYRLKLSFTRGDIDYHCSEQGTEEEQASGRQGGDSDEEGESSYWYYYDYDWSEYYENRENPCHAAYYRSIGGHDITVSRNVLVSDIGMIAKRGTDDTVVVALSDIRTAKPLGNALVKILDYQQAVLSEGRTDRDGLARLAGDRQAFLVVAENGAQKGYVRLQDGEALSVSHFDVAGENVRKGLKGFIYGERGVWRPGDSLFVTFVLLDRDNTLPADHPVSFELYNARGQKVLSTTRQRSPHGFHCYRIPTSPDAPTGDWSARATVGGVAFQRQLKVETIMPNRLKIRFDLDEGIKYIEDGTFSAALSATWLHGAIARDLNADIEVSLSAGKTKFATLEEYVFDDPARTYEPESRTIFEGSLDNEGKAMVSAEVSAENDAPGMLTASFRTRVFEPGGAFSVDRFSVPYSPYSLYVGVRLPKGDKARGMLLTDTTHSADIALVDANGTARTGRVEVKLYKVEWRWWWEKGTESLADYVESRSHKALLADTIDVRGGKGVWQFKIKYPEWGRYLVRARELSGGHASGKITYIDWPGWAGRGQKEMGGAATMLSFSSDKSEYEVGDDVTLTIPTGAQGRGLVSIESGSRVVEAKWFEATGEQSVQFTFKARAEMAPTVYAHVTFLQPHQQTGNDLPIRLYGVVPIKIVDKATVLEPSLVCDDVFTPEQTTKITVSENSGKGMAYTLAIVDEGLLDLTRFATPDPWAAFYAREALGVKTWDMYDQVAGAYAGSLERLLAIGGDGEGEDKGAKRAQRFPPMVRFYGPFELAKGKKATHEVDIPQYIGAVRVMLVAGRDRAYGKADKSVFVRKPLMLLGTLPRVLGPGEEVALPVSVFALEPKVRSVNVSVKTEGPLSVSGDAKQKITFDQPGDEVVNFALKVGEQPGIATVTIEASGAGEQASHTIEIEVRSPGRPVTNVTDTSLAPGATWSSTVALPGMAGTNAAVVEISRVLPMNLGKRLQWLIRYPHGCVEQTTSSVFPQIYLPKLVDLPKDKAAQVQNNINAGIDKLRMFQTSDGGFGYWPGGSAQEWASNYAGHFLVEAQKAGYVVPASVMDQWKKYQRNRASNWSSGRDSDMLTQAYRLYTLALAGAADIGAMNRLREAGDMPSAAQWHLAAAYTMAGQKEAGESLAKKAGTSVKKYRELGGTYGSDLRDRAMILEAACLTGNTDKALSIAKEISEKLCREEWMSTQTTAYCLIALARHAGLDGGGGRMSVTFTTAGGKEQSVTSDLAVVQVPVEIGQATSLPITMSNTSSFMVYPRVVAEGVPAPGQETAASNGMKLSVSYLTPGGSSLDPSTIEQGTDFVVELTVRNTGSQGLYEELALSNLVASGWEIRNERFEGTSTTKQDAVEYQDIRDDRVYSYFDLKQGESKTVRVMLNAAYLGRYYLPMQTVSAMYDETINARQPGQWVKVVTPGSGD
jgi:alpha-2-macroglobulin